MSSGLTLTSAAPTSTGINRWWTYEERSIPGVGKAMVNVANGNLLVQVDDADVPERGIDLAFRRTYNSQSQHTWTNDDGEGKAIYGAGWTNNFDAHMALGPNGDLAVFDIDGARYDYAPDGNGGWTPPPGQYAILQADGSCGYDWIKKNGTMYVFWSPALDSLPNCTPAAYNGRLAAIYGRNVNNAVILDYYWDTGAADGWIYLNTIVAKHSDTQTLTLHFSDVTTSTGTERLLQWLRRPDGSEVTYGYDSSGNLSDVCEIGNGSVDQNSNDKTCSDTVPSGQPFIHHQYGYLSGTHQLQLVNSAQWVMSNYTAGTFEEFAYDSSNRVISITKTGTVNPVIADGVSAPQPIQTSAPAGVQQYWQETLSYPSSSETQLTDSDFHGSNWFYDGAGRVTETDEYTGQNNLWLKTFATWDTSNNLIESVDARGYATDYAYDANGNTIAVALPSVTTSDGTIRPTSLYSYEIYNNKNYNNVSAYCDAHTVGSSGYDWSTRPKSDILCTSSTATRYGWDHSDTAEPYGQLSDSYTPSGYHRHYTYDTSLQAGVDAGLPTSVDAVGSFPQADGTTRQPHQGFHYDGEGNLIQYDTGSGSWMLTYDNLNRMEVDTDPDNVSSYKYYNYDGSISKTETAFQHQNNLGVTYSYDADGNQIKEFHHYGGSETAVNTAYGETWTITPPPAEETDKYYDGDDRLIEVQYPKDASDIYTNAWITRYLYDLTQPGVNLGAAVSYSYGPGSVSFKAYGNLFKTQELLPPGTSSTTSSASNTVYQDTKGTAFDALDRPINKYSEANDALNNETLTYDSTSAPNGLSTYGLLASDCDQLQLCSTFSYDQRGLESAVQFNNVSSPNRTMQYDADGRTTSVSNTTFGAETYGYDPDGHLTTIREPSGGGISSSATITHEYYMDGEEKQVDVVSSGLNQSGLFQYSYRPDGRVQTKDINYGALADVGSTVLSYTYSPAGSMLRKHESGAGANPSDTVMSYDPTTGLQTQIAYPGVTLAGINYDAEDEVVGYTGSGYWDGTGSLQYSARGELISLSSSGNKLGMANGVTPTEIPDLWDGTTSWDYRLGIPVSMSAFGTGTSSPTTSFSVSLDGASRMTGKSILNTSYDTKLGGTVQSTDRTTWQYDVDNRIISSTRKNQGYHATGPYDLLVQEEWGPDNHPLLVGSLNASLGNSVTASELQYDTLHWDGDTPLFETTPQGAVDEVFVGSDGAILPSDNGYAGLTFFDRTPDHAIAYCHNATGAASTAPAKGPRQIQPPAINCAYNVPAGISMPSFKHGSSTSDGIGFSQVVQMPRPDGINDGINEIQGVRVYDSGVGTWTTPDAYAGDVDDPMSQKAFMWNDNNPVVYEDPTGYASVALPIAGPAGAIGDGVGTAICGPLCGVVAGLGTAAAAILWHRLTHQDLNGQVPHPEPGPSSHAEEQGEAGGSVPVNQINNDIKSGRAPAGIKRVDVPRHGGAGQVHAHFDDGTSVNVDGSPSHNSQPRPTNAQKKYLNSKGFKIR